jgi:NAD-dependent deacetylase
MTTDTQNDKTKRAAKLFQQSKHAVAFSGAGISTESGIPDYRSAESGLWTSKIDPMAVASISSFKRDPQIFYDWVRPLAKTTLEAKPNPAHMALAELEHMSCLLGIITQNIDGLHARAGSKRVYELHGHMRAATCMQCSAAYNGDVLITQFIEDGVVPHCAKCQGVIKPNVVLYGEELPTRVLHDAQVATNECDLMLIVGSSLEVAPASMMPIQARRNGAKLVIVNLEPTHVDRMAEVVIHARAAEILPAIVNELKEML